MPDGKQVQMFFDGGCPICRREVMHYQRIDKAARVRWIDITRQPERLAALDPPVALADAMHRLHVLDRHGHMQTGVAAFACLWRELPCYRWLAPLVMLPGIHALLEVGYRRLTRTRLRGRCVPGAGRCAD